MSKYLSKKTILNGITFDSKKESERYATLLLLEKSGRISNLKRQVKYELQEHFNYNGKTIRAITYICDFEYIQDGVKVVEDVKSKFTAKDKVYSIKKKLLLKKYPDIEFREVIK